MTKMNVAKYKHYQQKIREVLLECGLIEQKCGNQFQFFTDNDKSFVFGEVFRMFDYDGYYYPKVVFFNKLEKNDVDDEYEYFYEEAPTELPFDLKENTLPFNMKLTYILDCVKYIATDVIKQRKDLAQKVKLESISEDF